MLYFMVQVIIIRTAEEALIVQLSGAAKLFQFMDRSFIDRYYKSTKWTGKTVKLSTKEAIDKVCKDISPLVV